MSLVPFKNQGQAPQRAYDPFQSFRQEFDRLMDSFMPHVPGLHAAAPVDFRCDMSETEKEVVVRAEIPGMEEKDIEVQLSRDILTIRGEKKTEKEEKDKNHHLVECSYGAFARALRLPFEPEADAATATYANGVLRVAVRKPAQKENPVRRVEVKKG